MKTKAAHLFGIKARRMITSSFWIVAIGAGIPTCFIYQATKSGSSSNTYESPHKDLEQRLAVITNEYNFQDNAPANHTFSYSYSFYIRGKRYTGDAYNPAMKIGNSILVEYVKGHPEINRPVIR